MMISKMYVKNLQYLQKNNKYVYKLCIYSTAVISVIYALDELVDFGGFSDILSCIPLYNEGFGWVLITALMFTVGIIILSINKKKFTK